MIERPVDTPRVPLVEPVEEAGFLRLAIGSGVRQLQEARAEHRGQREADQHRHHDRERHRPAERVDEALGVAAHERDRQEDHDERQRRRHDRQGDLTRALNRRLVRRHVLLLDVAEDVLEHDDRIVDDDAHRKRDGEERHVVQREPHDLHERKRRDDRRWDRERRDDDGADVADEEHHHDRREQRAEQQVFFERRDRVVDEARIVADDRDLDRRRQRPLDQIEPIANAFDDGDGVLAHRAPDVEHHRRRFAQPDRRRRSLEGVLGVADVGDANRRVVLRRDDDVVEVLRRIHASERAQQELSLALLDRATRDLDVLGDDRVAHLRHRQVVGVQLLDVDDDMDLASASAGEADLADAIDGLNRAGDLLVGELGDRPQTHRLGRDDQRHHRIGVRIDLGDDRREQRRRRGADRT